MPWRKDENIPGSWHYEPSLYAVNELPSWSEMYYDFYKGNVYTYNPKKEDNLAQDPYWKIPRRASLLCMVCNQFNKMLVEDGFERHLIDTLFTYGIHDIHQIRFILSYMINNEEMEDNKGNFHQLINTPDGPHTKLIGGDDMIDFQPLHHPKCIDYDKPLIWTISLPNGKNNDNIIDHPSVPNRINIREIDFNKFGLALTICIRTMIQRDNIADDTYYVRENQILQPYMAEDRNAYVYIIEQMMKAVRAYFEGTGVGWKDENGNIIEKEPSPNKCTTGFDPAL